MLQKFVLNQPLPHSHILTVLSYAVPEVYNVRGRGHLRFTLLQQYTPLHNIRHRNSKQGFHRFMWVSMGKYIVQHLGGSVNGDPLAFLLGQNRPFENNDFPHQEGLEIQ